MCSLISTIKFFNFFNFPPCSVSPYFVSSLSFSMGEDERVNLGRSNFATPTSTAWRQQKTVVVVADGVGVKIGWKNRRLGGGGGITKTPNLRLPTYIRFHRLFLAVSSSYISFLISNNENEKWDVRRRGKKYDPFFFLFFSFPLVVYCRYVSKVQIYIFQLVLDRFPRGLAGSSVFSRLIM